MLTYSRSTHRLECTKSPKWESVFTFDPSSCKEVISINFYQYLTPDDTTFLGPSIRDQNRFERGEINVGYLGRVMLELEKIPFGNIDDWFMIESPIENDRLMFPSCVHLRIQWVFIHLFRHQQLVVNHQVILFTRLILLIQTYKILFLVIISPCVKRTLQ